MKKIFIVIGGLDIGGTEKQLLLKLLSLKNNLNFSLILFSKKGELYDNFIKNGIRIYDISNNSKFIIFKIIKVITNLILLLRKEKPSIVNLYLPHSYLIFGWLAYFFPNIKFLMTRRSLNNYQKKLPFIKMIESKILHKRMKYILVNSRAIYKQMTEEENVNKEKLKLIYNSVEINDSKKEYLKHKKIRIIFLANLIPYKNHKLVIKACRDLKKLNFQINILGDGDKNYTKELQNLILKYNIEDKFKFYGKCKDLRKILNESDIGILSSNEEGFSNSILEYMAKKLPVIATDVGGNSEVVKHGYNGYIVKEGDYKSFAKFLKELILDTNLRKKLGSAGFKTVKEKFEVSKNIINYYNFYKNLLSNN